CGFAIKLLGKLHFLKRREAYQEHVLKFQEDFTDYTLRFRKKKGAVLTSLLLSFPQVILQMGVLFLIFLAFGYVNFSFSEITAMQTLLQSTVCFMPMPGASGAQEIGFSSFFGNYFTNNDLYTAVMVWRFFTYYIVVLAGAGLIVVDELINRNKRKKKLRNL
ncbi:MAG: YbhN family protein, partial [Oscillospiraceae bacterium]